MLRVGETNFLWDAGLNENQSQNPEKFAYFQKNYYINPKNMRAYLPPLTVAPLDYAILVRFTFSSNLNFHKKVAFIFGLQTL